MPAYVQVQVQAVKITFMHVFRLKLQKMWAFNIYVFICYYLLLYHRSLGSALEADPIWGLVVSIMISWDVISGMLFIRTPDTCY